MPETPAFSDGADPDRRIRNIINRARQETGLRDVVMFSIGHAWSVLQVLGALCLAVLEQLQDEPHVPEDSPPDDTKTDP